MNRLILRSKFHCQVPAADAVERPRLIKRLYEGLPGSLTFIVAPAGYGKSTFTEFFGKEPKVLDVGGGVAALSYVPDAGGPGLVSFGFQRSDEGFHADNEYMRIASLRKGQRAYARLLHALVGQPERGK